MNDHKPRILVIGYGNPGRLDDGLGPALAEALEMVALPGVTVDADYQLQVEDAYRLAAYDVVVFADASVNAAEPFELRPLQPGGEMSFTTHSISPGALLQMAQDHFAAETRAYTLAIRGYAFDDFGEEISEQALDNLAAATDFLVDALGQPTSLERLAVETPQPCAQGA